MVTLHIAQLLADEGFGTLDQDIFWESMPVDNKGETFEGIWIVPRGIPVTRFKTTIQAFDIYSRYSNKITGSQQLESILEYLSAAYGEVCELPEVPTKSETRYYDVQLTPVSGIENVGTDEQGMVIRVISGEINYKKEN